MKSFRFWMTAASVAAALWLAQVALSQTPAKPAAPAKGEAVAASEVTLETNDGQEYSFVAGEAVKNFAQAPSVTFKGPAGNTRTIKVRYPDKLQGVSVGDTVEITYTEALAITVEKAQTK